jgi:hypothetical protein
VNRRRVLPLVVGAVLCSIGVGLVLYGNTLPADFDVHGIWIFSYQAKYNILMLVGAFMVPIGISFLLLWFFTRTKPASPAHC